MYINVKDYDLQELCTTYGFFFGTFVGGYTQDNKHPVVILSEDACDKLKLAFKNEFGQTERFDAIENEIIEQHLKMQADPDMKEQFENELIEMLERFRK